MSRTALILLTVLPLVYAASNDTQDEILFQCIPPSINDFPEDFFTEEQRSQGGVAVHFLITFYLCAMLAVVCDDYFVPALEVISESLRLPSDVAGATFMAIGTSSPEFFSSVIGSFITEGDIGVGTIVGSAVFNILGVTSIAGLALWSKEVHIDWYPVSRDSTVYTLTVVALIITIYDNVVYWYESMILVLLFGLYIVLMYFNTHVERFMLAKMTQFRKSPKQVADEKSPLLPQDPNTDLEASVRESDIIHEKVKHLEKEEAEGTSLWTFPRGSCIRQFWWLIIWPTAFLFFVTIPDCRKERFRWLYPISFFVSVCWIAGLSYLTVWMVTIIGYTLGIPDTVAGITILAIGTSIPEVVSSVIVVRNGLGNMTICNLLGSNIFDILFCLGAPWLVKAAISQQGSLHINSSAMTYTTITLLSTVLMLYATFFSTNWKLNRRVGITCLILYALFMVLACLYELNVFGDFNPPTCP